MKRKYNVMDICRNDIINTLKSEFIDDDTVHALWLEGADAHCTVDEYSDIDMWLDVEDGHEEEIIQKMKKALETVSPLDFYYERKHGHTKIRQFFIRLKNTPAFLIIDLCLQAHSRKIEFVKENKDDKVKVIFDKSQVIKYRNVDSDKFNDEINSRKVEIEQTFEFFSIWVEKEIKRNNYLETLNYYLEYILSPFTEYLRLLHEPTKKDFGLKHIKADLPPDIVKKLEYLYKINSMEEIEKKMREVTALFGELKMKEPSRE